MDADMGIINTRIYKYCNKIIVPPPPVGQLHLIAYRTILDFLILKLWPFSSNYWRGETTTEEHINNYTDSDKW